jgi:hypothetical protein
MFYYHIVTCWGTGDAVQFVNSFYYDFISRHNYFLHVRSSLPCWFFILVGPLIAGFLVAVLIWLCVSDWFIWSRPLICSFLSKSTLLSRSSRTGARTPCPRVVFCLQFSVGCVAAESNSVRCSGKTLFEPLTSNAHICLSDVTCILEPFRRKWPYPSQYISTSLLGKSEKAEAVVNTRILNNGKIYFRGVWGSHNDGNKIIVLWDVISCSLIDMYRVSEESALSIFRVDQPTRCLITE